MLRTLWTGLSGMNANQDKIDAISNNLSNSGTMGYKRVDVGFKDLLSESLDRQGYPVNNKKASIGTGIKTSEWFRDNGQGIIQSTGRTSDIALDGEGFFGVTLPTGQKAYTRDGAFAIDVTGRFVDSEGNKLDLQYKNGFSENNVKFTKDNYSVDTDGSVMLKQNGGMIKVAEIPIYNALGDKAFLSAGKSTFVPVDGVQVFRTTNVDMHQGFLEGSNVDMATEFADMIVTQRAFELSSRGIKTADEMWGMVNNIRSR